jgi:prepilin-type N-terminal cleavage/methylation domain-containing protein
MNDQGLTLPEVLVAMAVLGILAGLGCISGAEALARQRLESASRTLGQGIEEARTSAMRQSRPCGMSLTETGWAEAASGALPPCLPDAMPLQEMGFGEGGLQIHHNMPPELRFSSNGLVLDGGTVVLTMRGTSLRRCLVMALPLGVVRVGRYAGGDGSVISTQCLPDASL